MKLSFILISVLISLNCLAQDQRIPYDEAKIPFDADWCALPITHQYLIKKVCYGYSIIEGDILVPGIQIEFNNQKILSVGCLDEAWKQIEENTYKFQCASAYGGHQYTLYESRKSDGYADRVWLQLTQDVLVETRTP